MTTSPDQFYPIGTTYQPEEAALPPDPAFLPQLNDKLQSTSSEETLQLAQKTLSKIASFFKT
jgi:hypothetical protein